MANGTDIFTDARTSNERGEHAIEDVSEALKWNVQA